MNRHLTIDKPRGWRHLGWIPAAATVGFSSAFLLTDVVQIPVVAYHLVYVCLVGLLVTAYGRITRLRIGALIRPRLALAISLGAVTGLALMRRVLADPPSTGPSGGLFVWDLLWRGVIYGTVDGVLLSAFPWLVTWRALRGESRSAMGQVGIGLVALVASLVVTSAYHVGYRDFRGAKLAQANLGNAIATLPTLLARNPMASPLAHAILHVTAVAHDPRSELFLPPHSRASPVPWLGVRDQ
jgi:hypothetical protein